MSDLDLEKGDEARAERIAAAKEQQDAGRARRTATKSKASGSKASASSRTDTDLIGRLGEAFTRLADQLEARQDHELADAIRDGKDAMSRSLVSLTRTVKVLRGPLVFLISFLEPVLAFWRVGGILARRFVLRRQRVMAEREMAAANVATTGHAEETVPGTGY